jgi:hypothetical protein
MGRPILHTFDYKDIDIACRTKEEDRENNPKESDKIMPIVYLATLAWRIPALAAVNILGSSETGT